MEVSNIILDKENQEIKVYFKHTDYCVSTKITFNTYRMYCEFNNLRIAKPIEVGMIEIDNVLSNLVLSELVSL